MNGPALLQALMDAAGDNAYAVATSLRKPALQSYIWKFLNGKAKEPRRSSLQPLADRYRVPVDAFYDPRLAERLAAERGLISGGVAQATTEPPVAPPTAPADDVLMALTVLATAIAKADENTRLSIEPLLAKLVREPDQSGTISQRIHDLLLLGTRPALVREDVGPGRRVQKALDSSKSMGPDGRRDSIQQQSGRK